MEYEFTFVVDGATVDDDSAASRLESELDAMLARADGQNRPGRGQPLPAVQVLHQKLMSVGVQKALMVSTAP
ncbi:hypothetical protein [Streptomyces niveus]